MSQSGRQETVEIATEEMAVDDIRLEAPDLLDQLEQPVGIPAAGSPQVADRDSVLLQALAVDPPLRQGDDPMSALLECAPNALIELALATALAELSDDMQDFQW